MIEPLTTTSQAKGRECIQRASAVHAAAISMRRMSRNTPPRMNTGSEMACPHGLVDKPSCGGEQG